MRDAMMGKTLVFLAAALLAAGLSCSGTGEEKPAASGEGKAIAVQVQGTKGCAAVKKTVELIETTAIELGYAVDLEVVTVESMEDAEALRFFGSPTVLVNGVDVEPGIEDPGTYGVT